jgi:hypothetical protein
VTQYRLYSAEQTPFKNSEIRLEILSEAAMSRQKNLIDKNKRIKLPFSLKLLKQPVIFLAIVEADHVAREPLLCTMPAQLVVLKYSVMSAKKTPIFEASMVASPCKTTRSTFPVISF